jgi:hypothetical protein
MQALYFLDPFNGGIFLVVDNKVKNRKRLKQRNLRLRSFAPDAVYDIRLKAKVARENGHDDGGISIFREPENDATSFVKHDTLC